MIITFKSRAAGDVIMFGDVAKRLLAVMGKAETSQGIITLDQLGTAIAALKQAMEQDKSNQQSVDESVEPRYEKTDSGQPREYVSLYQRAVPLLELLQYSLKAEKPVTWE